MLIHSLAILGTALLFGGMTLYSFGFAAFLFSAIPAASAGQRSSAKKSRRNRHYEKRFIRNSLTHHLQLQVADAIDGPRRLTTDAHCLGEDQATATSTAGSASGRMADGQQPGFVAFPSPRVST